METLRIAVPVGPLSLRIEVPQHRVNGLGLADPGERIDMSECRTGTCITCGIETHRKGARGKAPIRCDECRIIHRRYKSRAALHRPSRSCRNCGKAFIPRSSGRNKGLYCSRDCAFADPWRYDTGKACKVPWAECRTCKAPIIGRSKRKFCSECAAEHQRKLNREHYRLTYQRKPVGFYPCRKCGEDFFVQEHRGSPSFCPTCKQENIREQRRIHKAMRRARKRRAPTERIDPLEVFERDEWMCGICHLPLDRNEQAPHPEAPTVDHVIALANGGAHLMSNVQAAHFLCNSRKGAFISA